MTVSWTPPNMVLRSGSTARFMAIFALCCSFTGCKSSPSAQPVPSVSDDDGGLDSGSTSSDGDVESETGVTPSETIVEADGAEPPSLEGTPLERLWRVADQVMSQEDPTVWGREGRLGPEQLTCGFTSRGVDGLEAFNVMDSDGYVGDLKCNLLAFEMAYRAGLQVPLVGRGRGWGYPGPNVVAEQVLEGGTIGRWGVPIARPVLTELEAALGLGTAFLTVGAGHLGQPGHMGVVDQIHRLELDTRGRVHEIEYSGWEAGSERAQYGRRTWRIGRYTEIYLIQLRDPPEGESQVVPLGFGPLGPSVADAARHTPDGGLEVQGCPRKRGLPELPVVHGVLGERSSWGHVVNVKQATKTANQSPRGGRDDRRPRKRGLPRLPVAHGVLGESSSWGRVVDVEQVAGEH